MLNEVQSNIIQYNRVQLNTTNSEQSLLDHVYKTKIGMTTQIKLSDPIFGDHKLITFMLTKTEKTNYTKTSKQR